MGTSRFLALGVDTRAWQASVVTIVDAGFIDPCFRQEQVLIIALTTHSCQLLKFTAFMGQKSYLQ
jgi:hypothetical protein